MSTIFLNILVIVPTRCFITENSSNLNRGDAMLICFAAAINDLDWKNGYIFTKSYCLVQLWHTVMALSQSCLYLLFSGFVFPSCASLLLGFHSTLPPYTCPPSAPLALPCSRLFPSQSARSLFSCFNHAIPLSWASLPYFLISLDCILIFSWFTGFVCLLSQLRLFSMKSSAFDLVCLLSLAFGFTSCTLIVTHTFLQKLVICC